MRKIFLLISLISSMAIAGFSQEKRDSIHLADPGQSFSLHPVDTSLRIINLNPFFSLHVDSSLTYRLQINKDPKKYYWYLKNAPAGLRIDKDNGTLSFKSNKALFMSGRLNYDVNYPVSVGVQNLYDPHDKVDTSFTITFYNTDVILPRLKPSVVSPVTIEEGNKLYFNVMCGSGNFPIDRILFTSDISISNFKIPKTCDDTFEWIPPYDFVNEKDSGKVKIIKLFFIGTTKFNFSDTAVVKVIVKDALNYDIATADYKEADSLMRKWIKDLKYTFFLLDKKVRRTKSYRSTFDITSATSTVTGTVVSTASNNKNAGKILPSAGIILLPVKEAAAPNKTVEQNQASLLRSTYKRLEYTQYDNRLSGDRDPAILQKTETLKKELRQTKIQLSEVPTDSAEKIPEAELDKMINSRRVQKKYRLK